MRGATGKLASLISNPWLLQANTATDLERNSIPVEVNVIWLNYSQV